MKPKKIKAVKLRRKLTEEEKRLVKEMVDRMNYEELKSRIWLLNNGAISPITKPRKKAKN